MDGDPSSPFVSKPSPIPIPLSSPSSPLLCKPSQTPHLPTRSTKRTMAAAAYREWSLLPDDITRDIFARVQPHDPSYFFRVSHLCKGWRRALSDPDFARRLHDRNAAPLLVGFLHDRDDDDEHLPPFFRTAASPFSPKDAPDRRDWKVLDYRHGRALFISKRHGELGRKELLIWDPVTGLQRRVPVAPQASRSTFPGAAVVCAAPGCTHRPGCNGAGDFQVALLFSDDDPQFDDEAADEEEAPPQIKGFLYSSHSDTWTEVATVYGMSEDFGDRPSVLAGESLYFLSDGLVILQFDMSANTLSEIALPDMEDFCDRDSSLILVHDDNGGIGMAEATDGDISIWSRDTRDDGDVSWSLTRTFDRSDLHLRGPMRSNDQSLLGFVQGSSVIFLATSEGTFTFDLTSGLAKIVVEDDFFNLVLPVVYLCAPLNGLQHIQAQQLHEQPKPTEEDKCEGGIKVAEDALQVAGHLFTKGWNDVENGDFNSAVQCLRDSLEIRTGHYGKFAPECASTYYRYGCALLYKAQEMTYLVDDEGGYLSLSSEMLDIARSIVEKNPDSTMGIAEILSALTKVLIQREKKGAALTKSTEAKTESIK